MSLRVATTSTLRVRGGRLAVVGLARRRTLRRAGRGSARLVPLAFPSSSAWSTPCTGTAGRWSGTPRPRPSARPEGRVRLQHGVLVRAGRPGADTRLACPRDPAVAHGDASSRRRRAGLVARGRPRRNRVHRRLQRLRRSLRDGRGRARRCHVGRRARVARGHRGRDAVAATSVFLALVNFDARPAGFGALEPAAHPSIWTLPRGWSQSIQPEVSRMIEYLDAHAPPARPSRVTRTRPSTVRVRRLAADRAPLVYADSLDEATRGAPRGRCSRRTSPAPPAGARAALRQWAVYRHVPGASCR